MVQSLNSGWSTTGAKGEESGEAPVMLGKLGLQCVVRYPFHSKESTCEDEVTRESMVVERVVAGGLGGGTGGELQYQEARIIPRL